MNSKQKLSILVNRIKKGDHTAFKSIHEIHYKKLAAFINGYTKNNSETEDILQDTFIKLWNSRKKLDAIGSINSFLYKTAYNTFIDKYRKEKGEQNMLDGWKYKRLMENIDEDDETNNKRIEKLNKAIEKLPARCKEVFILCKYENLSYADIANQLGISPKTVQAQMCKAYQLIRERFKDNDFLNLFLCFPDIFISKGKM